MVERDGYAAFRDLYEPWARSLIEWSEGDVLDAKFLQLHEKDIGLNIGDYNLWRYIGAFTANLGELRERIQRLVFCYSFENRSFLSPEECELRSFYYYKFEDVATVVMNRHEPPQSWKDKLEQRPPLAEVQTDLEKALNGCDWVQPYMLRATDKEKLISLHQLGRWTPEMLNKMLAAHTKEAGAYQFSICGYEMKEGQKDLSEPERAFLELSYLVHAWNWNHDLNATHKKLRRVVTRTAAVGVMGRNMSHNIGSHVLARYASELGRDDRRGLAEKSGPSGPIARSTRSMPAENHEAAFLRYLQRRMDFIAEISTAEKSFWSQSLNLGAVLQKLDLEREGERINAGGTNFDPILLSHISGKEGISATVVPSAHLDGVYFSSPGGEVGIHALYVILENVIRNSARHNPSGSAPIRIEVRIEPARDLWKLTIADRQSSLSDRESLAADINKIIGESLVEKDGKVSHRNWGIREMQICAHYLRQISLSDLGEMTEETKAFPVLEAVKCHREDEPAHLGYCLYLKKPKICAIVALRDLSGQPITAGRAEIAPGVTMFADAAEAQELGAYDFVVTAGDVLPLKDGLGGISLPVRTIEIQRRLMKRLIPWIGRNGTDPTRLIELLNNLTWREYRRRRNHWRNKRQVDALVAWLVEPDGNGSPPGRFSHQLKESPLYKAFAGVKEVQKNPGRICLAWVDHANSEDFADHKSPNLASAYKKVSESRSAPIVFAEVFDRLGPHTTELEKQRSHPGSGNELIAAALARVAILDERVQSEYRNDYRGDIPYNILWPCMGVWVPPPDTGLDLNKHPTFAGIQAFLTHPTTLEEQLPIDFLVIHLTLLENLRRQCGHGFEQETLKLLCKGTQVSMPPQPAG